ncbi:hypothetical protein VF21_01440 [Pseudogymnoascus sp. 05NY08]|nr:hypothetical protein VF21_01440 [Pseudogymnoascus sp. 05NY08]
MSEPVGNTAGPHDSDSNPLYAIKNIQLRQEFDRLIQEAIRLENASELVDNSTKQLLLDRYRLIHAFDTRIKATIELGEDATILGPYVKRHWQQAGLIQPLPGPPEQLIIQNKRSIENLRQSATEHESTTARLNHDANNLAQASSKLEQDMNKLQQDTDQLLKRVKDEGGMDPKVFDSIIGDMVKNVVAKYMAIKNQKLHIEL